MKVLVYKNLVKGADKTTENIEAFKNILKEISQNLDLESLVVSGNSISEIELEQLAKVLTNNKQLKYLSLN